MIDLDAIKARYEAAMKGPWYTVGPRIAQKDIPALVAEVERLRGSLEAILDEAISDLNRDIIITECQSALREEEAGDAGT